MSRTGEPIVLIVEDIPVNLMLAEAVMAAAGYYVITASSAEEALRLLRSVHPNVILMDVQLPGVDGLTLTRQLKADPTTARIPVIALTAHAMKGDEEAALAAGCDGYISKPLDTRTLAAQVDTIVAGFRRAAPPQAQ
jgi:CheY-like chemotaxis protein